MGDLTTLARVKTDENISNTSFDTQFTELISNVSAEMEAFMRRTITDTTYTDEVHSGDGWTDQLVLKNYPLTSTTTIIVKEDDVAMAATEYSKNDDEAIIYREGSTIDAGVWTQGTRNFKVTYSAGYTTVPGGLVLAATEEVRHRFHQTKKDDGRLGLQSNADETGGGTTYVPGSFLPSTIEAMKPYMRRS